MVLFLVNARIVQHLYMYRSLPTSLALAFPRLSFDTSATFLSNFCALTRQPNYGRIGCLNRERIFTHPYRARSSVGSEVMGAPQAIAGDF